MAVCYLSCRPLITRVGGELQIILLLPHGPNPSQEVAFPAAIEDAPDGVIDLPFDEPMEHPQPVEVSE